MSKPIYNLRPLYNVLVKETDLQKHVRLKVAEDLGVSCNQEFHHCFNYVTDFLTITPNTHGIESVVGEDKAQEILTHFYLWMTPSSLEYWKNSAAFSAGLDGLALSIFYTLPPVLKHPFYDDIPLKTSLSLPQFILITSDIIALWEGVLGVNFGLKTPPKNT